MKPVILPSAANQITFETLAPNTFKKQILRFGRWVRPDNNETFIKVDKDLAEKLVANFKAGHFGHVAIPRGHNEDDPALNTGSVVDLSVQDDGIYATCAIQDEAIAERIRKGLISDCSVAIQGDYKIKEGPNAGKVVGPVLRHLALTNQPYIKNLHKWEPAAPVQIHAGEEEAEVLYFSEDKPTMNREQLIAEAKKIGIDVVELEKLMATNQKLAADLQASETAKKAAEAERDTLKAKADKKEPIDFKLEDQPAFKTLQSTVTTLSESNKEKDKTIEKLEKDNRHAKAEAEVTPLVDKGFILAKDKPTYVELAENQPDMWQKIKPTLNVKKVELGERGAHTEPKEFATVHMADGDAEKEITRIAEAYLPKPKQLTK